MNIIDIILGLFITILGSCIYDEIKKYFDLQELIIAHLYANLKIGV